MLSETQLLSVGHRRARNRNAWIGASGATHDTRARLANSKILSFCFALDLLFVSSVLKINSDYIRISHIIAAALFAAIEHCYCSPSSADPWRRSRRDAVFRRQSPLSRPRRARVIAAARFKNAALTVTRWNFSRADALYFSRGARPRQRPRPSR